MLTILWVCEMPVGPQPMMTQARVREPRHSRLLEMHTLGMIAVLLVVVYRVWPWRIMSGFVRVDVEYVR